MNASTWYTVNASAGSPEVLLYGEIGGFGISAADFINEVKGLKSKSLTLRINSPGGSVFDGLAIYNYLRTLNVSVVVDGLAASMGSVIAMAGKKVKMARGAMMMVHNPWTSVGGDSAELRRAAEFLDKTKDSIVSTYAAKTGKPASEIVNLMDDETWMGCNEAVELGFADETDDEDAKDFSAFNLSGFRNAPGTKKTSSKPDIQPTNEGTIMATNKNLEVEFAQTSAALKDAEGKLFEFAVQVNTLTAERDELKAKHEALTAEQVKQAEALQASALEINVLKDASVKSAEAYKALEESFAGRIAAELAKVGQPQVDLNKAGAAEEDFSKQSIGELAALSLKIADESKRADFYKKWIAPKLK
jgi:ATP-dependent Clp endopeptidase proteolytic subunit ClpP